MSNIEAVCVATDLDSTVLPPPNENGDNVPPTSRVLSAFERLYAADKLAIGVTSRNEQLMQGEMVRSLGLQSPCVLDGGATLYDPLAGIAIERRWLPPQLIRGVVGALGQLCTSVYCDPEGHRRTPDSLAISTIDEPAPSIFMVFDRANQEEIAGKLAGSPDGLTYHFNSMDGSERVSCVQVTAHGVTKLSGLYRALERIDVNPRNVMGVGDGPADAEFIRAMGVSVVMGNATLDMLAMVEEGALLVPSVQNDGFAIAVERHVFGEEGSLIKKRHPQWRDGTRPMMHDAVRDKILIQLHSGDPLVDTDTFNTLVDRLSESEPVDPWQTMVALTECLKANQELMTCDLDLLRPCLGIEHSSGVLGVFEEHYAQLFYHDTEALAAVRLALALQDIGKVLSVAVTGDNFSQAKFNAPILKNISEVLVGAGSDKLRIAVQLLAAIDFVGDVMKASEEDVEQVITKTQRNDLAMLEGAWPEGFQTPLEDFIVAMYLSDAGAHTRYAAQINATTGEIEWAVTHEDAQLTFLFEQMYGDILTLRPDLGQRLLRLLPGIRYMRDSLGLSVHNRYDTSGNEPVTTENAVELFREDLRLLLIRGVASKAITEMDTSGDTVIELSPSSLEIAPILPDVRHALLHLADKEAAAPSRPPQIARPYVEVYGQDIDGIPTRASFYIRGGRIWLKTESGVTDRINMNIQRAMDDLDRTDALRSTGVRGLAAYNARVTYGRPLNDSEVDEFLGWFGLSEVLWVQRQ